MNRHLQRHFILPLCPRRGSVLILVMWMTLGLIAIALTFGQTMLFEYKAAANTAGGLQAEYAIDGARRYVTYILDNMEDTGRLPDVDDDEIEAQGVQVGQAHFWLLGRDVNTLSGNGEFTFGLVDEAGKLNLNTATQEMLEELPGMTSQWAAAIIDWRDSDSELTESGAESQTYSALDPAYQCKNANFESVEELRMVYDAQTDELYGEDTNGNGVLDANENDGEATWPDDNADGLLDAGLWDYVTVWSRQSNADSDGNMRINVTSTDSSESLSQLLSDKLGQSRGSQVMQKVQGQSIGSVLEFYYVSGLTADEFEQVEGSLGASDEDLVDGLINVNCAPLAVLACVPGLDKSTAQNLISVRKNKSNDDLVSLAWVKEVLSQAQATQAGPYLTATTCQYRADIVAIGENGHGFRREMMIFDTSSGEAKQIYRQDLTRAGWPLGVGRDNQVASAK